VRTFLAELQRDPSIASVLAKNDFPYHGHGPGAPRIEREYWLQVSLSSLASRDGFVILHVHYAGEWKSSDDQATFDRKRSTITQINARHTWDGSSGRKFPKPVQDPGGALDGKWREGRGEPLLGSTEAPHGWRWREASERNLTAFTPCLQDLLQKGERCIKVVRKKYVECLDAAGGAAAAPASTSTGGGSSAAIDTGAGASERAQEGYREPEWSQLPAARPCPSPLTILFVGVDNGNRQSPELNLNAEFQKIEDAWRAQKLGAAVNIKRIFYARWPEVMEAIAREDPSVLHLGCHSTKEGLELFQRVVTPEMIRQLQHWNEHARTKGRAEIRLVVVNSCESDGLAQEFAKFVDFAVGHVGEVEDREAISFSNQLYGRIFDMCPLLRSFQMARSASDGYRLHAPATSPVDFLLVSRPADGGEDRAYAELVQLLKSRGLGRVARAICDKLDIERKDELLVLTQRDMDGLQLKDGSAADPSVRVHSARQSWCGRRCKHQAGRPR
jgi:hypothetical protein